ncbi:MAG: prepilin-type N-terminal cleavage/methylation domain-containing protein [bacterium]
MNTKSGFTLVELMVVAIIVAILMSVAVPLMLGNKKKAMATEGQTGLGVVRSALQVYKVENGHYPDSESGKTMDHVTILMVKSGDLDGTYFKTDGYRLTTVTMSNFNLTATGYTNDAAGGTVTLDSDGHWGGTML